MIATKNPDQETDQGFLFSYHPFFQSNTEILSLRPVLTNILHFRARPS